MDRLILGNPGVFFHPLVPRSLFGSEERADEKIPLGFRGWDQLWCYSNVVSQYLKSTIRKYPFLNWWRFGDSLKFKLFWLGIILYFLACLLCLLLLLIKADAGWQE